MSAKPTRRWRSFGYAAAALLVSAFLSPAVAQSDLLELKLAVADPNVNPVTDSVLKLADTMGYYKAHGLHVTIVTLEGTPQAVAALNSGAVDLSDISVDSTLRLRAQNNVALRGVVSMTLGPPYLIAARSDIAKVGDLVGRTYAINDNGSLDHNLTRHVLVANGVDPDGPKYVAIGAPSVRAQALAAGRVDATTVSYGSFLPIASTPGLSILVSPDDFFKASPIESKFVAALEPTIDKKREAIQRFVDALVDISRAYDTDSSKWVDAMVKAREDLKRDDLVKTVKLLDGRWCVNGCLDVGNLQNTVDFIYGSPDFKDVPVLKADDILDESFVRKAEADLGAYKGGGIDARP